MKPFSNMERAFRFIRIVARWRPVSVLIAPAIAPDGELIPMRRVTVYGAPGEYEPEVFFHGRRAMVRAETARRPSVYLPPSMPRQRNTRRP